MESGPIFHVGGHERLARSWRLWRVYAFVCLILISAALRLVDLGQVPPFVDEDGYSTFAHNVTSLTWKQILFHSEILLPLTGDKPPLAILLQAWLNLLVGDVVIAGRLLSAVAGIATTAVTFVLARKLGGSDVGLVSMAAYACSPLAVLHERMVLQDPLMSACSLAAIVVAWTAMQRRSPHLSVLAAVLGAMSVQFKVSGLVTAPLMLVLIVTANQVHRTYWYPAVVGVAGVVLSYLLLMAAPGSANLQDQNQKLLVPLGFLRVNLEVLRDTVATYFPWGLPLLGMLGIVAAVRTRRGGGLMCGFAVIAWVLPWVVLSRFAPSRYYVPATPYACALIGLGVVWFVSQAGKLGPALRITTGAVVGVVFVLSGVASAHVATDLLTAPLSTLDDCQYRSCWPSGYPYRAARDFVAAALPSGSNVAYMIDIDHRVALGLDRPPPAGINSLGVVKKGDALPIDSVSPLYVVVDDVRESDPGSGLDALLARYPQFTLVAQFLRPGSAAGVSIVIRH